MSMSRAKGTMRSGVGRVSLNDLSSSLDNFGVLRGFVQLLEGARNYSFFAVHGDFTRIEAVDEGDEAVGRLMAFCRSEHSIFWTHCKIEGPFGSGVGRKNVTNWLESSVIR